jgi:CRP/FNR family transcriptional regulator, nitrogen fixation regulation protein
MARCAKGKCHLLNRRAAIDLRDNFASRKSRVTVGSPGRLGYLGLGSLDVCREPCGRTRRLEGMPMFRNLNTDPAKKPRLLGELGDLSHAKVSSSEFKYKKDSEIFGQKEPADYIYQVIEGAVRTHKLLSDGRRQIGAFHLPGDIFGLENGDLHRFTAEAIVETTVRLVKRQSLEREAKNDPAMVRNLLKMTTDNLQHVENHLLLLGRQSATEKVAAFLLEMNGRMKSTRAMALPMSRRDIGDYLGLTIETVSRVLMAYQRKGYLKVGGPLQREIIVLNPAGLAELDRENMLCSYHHRHA